MRRALRECLALLIALAALPVFGRSETGVFIELDHIQGPPGHKSLTLKGFRYWYGDQAFKVKGAKEQHQLRSPLGNCPTMNQLYDLAAWTKNSEVPHGVWYVHGLTIPATGLMDPTCKGVLGVLLMLPNAYGRLGQRETFIVFDGNFALSQWEDRLDTAVHELFHVLNVHHCEMNVDVWQNYNQPPGALIRKHLKSRHIDEEHVKPGGDVWCAHNHFHQTRIHDPYGTVPPTNPNYEPLCSPYAPDACDPYSAPIAGDENGAGLTVRPERRRYFPGEPIDVDLELEADGKRDDLYYQKGSLEGSSRELFFSVLDSPDSAQTLPKPALIDVERDLLQLRPGDVVRSEGVGLWFGLPPQWYEWDESRDAEKSLRFIVGYGLYSPREEKSGSYRGVRIRSEPVEITIGLDGEHPELFHPVAHELFIHWQSRRFVWLGGSHVLPEGRRNLERIARDYPQTIYAVYAELALGEYCYPSLLKREPARATEARCREALGHLQNAHRRRDELPPSYQKRLDEALARVGQVAFP